MADDKIDLKQICLNAAKEIADGMKPDTVPFAEKTDALKALTSLYTAFRKHPSEDDDENEGFDFAKGVVTPASQDHLNGNPRVHASPQRRRNTAVS